MKKFASILLCLCFVAPAYAGTSNKTGLKFGGSGFYVYNKTIDGEVFDLKAHGVGWNLFVGFRLNDFIGFRAGYYAIRDKSFSGTSLNGYGPKHYRTKAYDAIVSLNFPLGYCTDVVLNLGAATVDLDAVSNIHNIDTKKILPEIGVALHSQHNRILATEWTLTHMHHNDTIKDINIMSFGVALTFPL